jgi:hypothetical protein
MTTQFKEKPMVHTIGQFSIYQLDATRSKIDRDEMRKEQILDNFKTFRPNSNVKGWEAFSRLLNVSKTTQEWHAEFGKALTFVNDCPESLIKAGMGPLEWELLDSERNTVKKQRQDAQKALNDASAKYKTACRHINNELFASIDGTRKYLRIIEISSQDLDERVLDRIAALPDSIERSRQTKLAVEKLKSDSYLKFKETGDLPGVKEPRGN